MQLPHAKYGTYCFLNLLLVLFTSSCERRTVGTVNEPVIWPQLTRFDEVASRAEGFARAGNLAAVREFRVELLETGRALTPASIPANSPEPQQVKVMLDDLKSLMDDLTADEIDNDTLNTLVLGLHTIIENLMNAAGMPHIHEHGH